VETIAAPLLFRFLVARRPLSPRDAEDATQNYLAMLRGRSQRPSTSTPPPEQDR
jgi:hypothetical protein